MTPEELLTILGPAQACSVKGLPVPQVICKRGVWLSDDGTPLLNRKSSNWYPAPIESRSPTGRSNPNEPP